MKTEVTYQEKVVNWEKHLIEKVKKGQQLGEAAFAAQQDNDLSTEDIEALGEAVDNVSATIQELLRPIY